MGENLRILALDIGLHLGHCGTSVFHPYRSSERSPQIVRNNVMSKRFLKVSKRALDTLFYNLYTILLKISSTPA